MTPARSRGRRAVARRFAARKARRRRKPASASGVINGLVDEGTLERSRCRRDPVPRQPDPRFRAGRIFRRSSKAAAQHDARAGRRNGRYQVALLDGVTGSGKTEVYFEAVAETIRRGRQALILLPEIALTAQFLDRFAERFGARPAEWHSEMTPRKRARDWRGCRGQGAGRGRRALGAVPALRRSGLIVVDEEHDAAYKQDDGVHYHARDMAVVRGTSPKFR